MGPTVRRARRAMAGGDGAGRTSRATSRASCDGATGFAIGALVIGASATSQRASLGVHLGLEPRRLAPDMRKARQAQPLSSLIQRITAGSFEARGLAAAGIAAEWPAIVGETVAACSWPDRLRPDGTLRICVSGPVAVELQHLEPQILERIAAYYGYRAVTRIALRKPCAVGATNDGCGAPNATQNRLGVGRACRIRRRFYPGRSPEDSAWSSRPSGHRPLA